MLSTNTRTHLLNVLSYAYEQVYSSEIEILDKGMTSDEQMKEIDRLCYLVKASFNSEALSQYEHIIRTLMHNDPNGSYDTILQEATTLVEAILEVNEILGRLYAEHLEERSYEEAKFYGKLLMATKQIVF